MSTKKTKKPDTDLRIELINSIDPLRREYMALFKSGGHSLFQRVVGYEMYQRCHKQHTMQFMYSKAVKLSTSKLAALVDSIKAAIKQHQDEQSKSQD
jgi:hypothetical protein